LIEENCVLREQVGGRRLRLSDCQRRRLAVKGKRLGRRLLTQVASIVTPDTILRWQRRLIAAKWTFPGAGTGRPGAMKEIRRLIVQMATENSSWGYCRIEGALRNLGHSVSPSTVRNVLKENGIHPAPNRPTTWGTFLKAHWGANCQLRFLFRRGLDETRSSNPLRAVFLGFGDSPSAFWWTHLAS